MNAMIGNALVRLPHSGLHLAVRVGWLGRYRVLSLLATPIGLVLNTRQRRGRVAPAIIRTAASIGPSAAAMANNAIAVHNMVYVFTPTLSD